MNGAGSLEVGHLLSMTPSNSSPKVLIVRRRLTFHCDPINLTPLGGWWSFRTHSCSLPAPEWCTRSYYREELLTQTWTAGCGYHGQYTPYSLLTLTFEHRFQPRSLELFAYLRIVEDVMKRAILTPTVRLYKMPEGREVVHQFEMSPHQHPTPTNPFVCWLPRSYFLVDPLRNTQFPA